MTLYIWRDVCYLHSLHVIRLFAQVYFQLNTWNIFEMWKTYISQLIQTRNRDLFRRNHMCRLNYKRYLLNARITYFYSRSAFSRNVQKVHKKVKMSKSAFYNVRNLVKKWRLKPTKRVAGNGDLTWNGPCYLNNLNKLRRRFTRFDSQRPKRPKKSVTLIEFR